MSPAVALAAFLLVDLAAPIGAADFLKPQDLTREDVKQFLLSELMGYKSSAQVQSIEKGMGVMFQALPKSKEGLLEPETVRYALHRYFVQKHGWYVKGLDRASGVQNLSSAGSVMKARAPAYIQSIFEERLHGKGLGLHELAVFAATLSDLIHAETVGRFDWIYAALNLDSSRPITPVDADAALDAFVVAFLMGGEQVAHNRVELRTMKQDLSWLYPDLNESSLWFEDLRHTYNLEQESHRNPFVEQTHTFEESVAVALEFSHRFGAFQNLECHKLKRRLVEMEHLGTGRVPLASFYQRALAGEWEFMESEEYLRNQGALDETDPHWPSVVIANYLNSQANCLTGSYFYSVCCMNECEGLMARLEQQLAAPSAKPERIAQVVSALQSDTVDAPRNLSIALQARLEEIAEFHGGGIPLHGRLFAQWMHHAYPRECLFPHITSSLDPMSPEEWIIKTGKAEATKGDMSRHAKKASELSAKFAEPLPWTSEEELVAEHKHASEGKRLLYGIRSLQVMAAIAALVSFTVPLLQTLRTVVVSQSKTRCEKHLV